MENKAKEIKLVPIENLIPNPKNNNRHSVEQLDRLAKIIKYQGFRDPLIISNRSGFVVCGHARVEAAKKLGIKELPCICQDFESEAQEYAHMTADNEIARWAELDMHQVLTDLKDIQIEEIEFLGIENFTIDGLNTEPEEIETRDSQEKKYVLEITFPNEMEMMDIHDDLLPRGYIVRIK